MNMDTTEGKVRIGLLLTGVALFVGSFMPWLTASAPFIGTLSRSGVDGGGDGTFTAGAGVILGVIAFVNVRPTGRGIVAMIVGGGAALLAIYDFTKVNDRVEAVTSDSDFVSASVGTGLYLVIAAAIAAVALGAVAVRQRPAPVSGGALPPPC